ncbi:MAG TPA: SDR family NAD(P)-dependent oxidoreductase [Burkholderiales bacterium]|nr:SDR family NAD(P)-dependent oxidoreductase [Burkholderiales bacterium]
MTQSERLAGHVAIVTAGGQGIGEAIAKTFAREGARVAVVDLNGVEAERVAREINAAKGEAVALETDVTVTEAVEKMVKTVLERWGTVDVLVNAAGGFHRLAPITDISDEEWDTVMRVNLKSTFLCSRAVAPTMIERRKGRIINIASGSGIAPNPYAQTYLPYGAAKAGVINFSKVLGRDLGQYGITVNSISPGTTATPRVVKVRDAESMKRIAEQNPMRTLVQVEDSAEAALYLASPEARHVTGVNLNVNAGNLM